jgi:hypothetical protein
MAENGERPRHQNRVTAPPPPPPPPPPTMRLTSLMLRPRPPPSPAPHGPGPASASCSPPAAAVAVTWCRGTLTQGGRHSRGVSDWLHVRPELDLWGALTPGGCQINYLGHSHSRGVSDWLRTWTILAVIN